jgi:hypothetical protein
MKITKLTFIIVFALLAKTAKASVQHQTKVAIDPRSAGETEAELLSPNFRNSCLSVSIVRDESEAEYMALASESHPGFFMHYSVTLYDKQGKVVFATDKHETRNTVKAFCQFMNTQK